MVRAASSISRNCWAAGGKFELSRTPTNRTPGTSSRSRPNRFGSIRLVSEKTPVALLPGRLKLLTKPAATGSLHIPKMKGKVDVARLNFRFSRALPPGGLAHVRADV